MKRQYGFDSSSLTYFEKFRNGSQRSIPVASIKLDINRFALGVQLEQRNLMTQMMDTKITPQQWYDESARLMKLSYRAAVDVARGTNQEMSEDEKKRWLLLALLLFLLLNNTADGLVNGTIPFDLRLPIYAGLRGGALRSLFENWRLRSARIAGYTEGRRVLGVAEHCEPSKDRPGCVELAKLGWMPIEQVVPIGDATCLDNCKCTILTRGKKPSIFGSP